MVRYEYVTAHISDLQETIDIVNRYQDKIVAVTQNGDCYTIFLESYGNAEKQEGGL